MLDKIANKLLSHDKIYIITHENPDGDALGSSFALKFTLNALGIDAEVVLNAPLPVSFKFTGWKPCLWNESLSADCVVGLDFNVLSRAGNSASIFEKAEDKILIDHHLGCEMDGEFVESRPQAAATGEIIFDLLKLLTNDISREAAEGIYIAIMTDTGGCRYSNTTKNTHLILADLIDKIDHSYITRMVLEIMSREKLEIHKFALNNFEFYKNGEICTISVDSSMMKNEDLLNGVVNIALNIEGVKAGVLFKQRDENITKVSLRTAGEIDAREICALFAGGGHKNAAGCTIEMPLCDAKMVFVDRLSERI